MGDEADCAEGVPGGSGRAFVWRGAPRPGTDEGDRLTTDPRSADDAEGSAVTGPEAGPAADRGDPKGPELDVGEEDDEATGGEEDEVEGGGGATELVAVSADGLRNTGEPSAPETSDAPGGPIVPCAGYGADDGEDADDRWTEGGGVEERFGVPIICVGFGRGEVVDVRSADRWTTGPPTADDAGCSAMTGPEGPGTNGVSLELIGLRETVGRS